jgi:hypothetical protein
MKIKIISKFKSEINGVEISDERVHNSIVEILEALEKKFQKELNSQFIKDLAYTLENFDGYLEVMDEIMYSISIANSIQELEFDYSQLFEGLFDNINQNFKNNSYLK